MKELAHEMRRSIALMKKGGVRKRFFALSLSLSLGLTLFSLYNVSLLFPLIDGIIKNDFSAVKGMPGLGAITRAYPEVFTGSVRLFVLLVIWVYGTILIKNALQYGALLSAEHQTKHASVALREALLGRYLSFGRSFYDKNKTSRTYEVLMKSANVIKSQFKLLQRLIIDVFLLIMNFSVMFWVSWRLTLIACAVLPVMYLVSSKLTRYIKDQARKTEASSQRLNDRILDVIGCLPVVKGFVKDSHERLLFGMASRQEAKDRFKSDILTNLAEPIEDISMTTATLLVAFGMALLFHIDASIDPTKAFMFVYLSMRIIPGLNSLNRFKMGMARDSVDIERVNEILESNDDHVIPNGTDRFITLKKGIELRNLSFSYVPGGAVALKGLSLMIPKGKMTAIVGPTGSGKSTITHLLLRSYDCPPDSIFVDGKDIRLIDADSLRKRISFVTQETFIFNDTIRNNLMYGATDVERGDIRTDERGAIVFKKAKVDDFVAPLPEGYDTIIGERGAKLSGGEKQRLSIARALVRDADILILDEATSALDAATEAAVIEAIEELYPDKTLLVISHRLSTIRKADHVVFLEKGEAKEEGTVQELIDRKGKFFTHWNLHKS